MLLIEVLTKPSKHIKQVKRPIVWNPLSTRFLNPIGGGFQSVAYEHHKHPNSVIKQIQITGITDPSYQFLRLCLNHQNNSYFPKIYAATKYSDRTGYKPNISDKHYDERTEYEYPMQPFFDESIIVVMEKLYHVSNMNNILTKLSLSHIPYNDTTLNRPFDDPEFRKKVFRTTSDRNLRQALRLLEPLLTNYHPDMGHQNIMQRTNGQLVFVDPVAHRHSQLPDELLELLDEQ